jgi:tRNA (adenine57-N1/adenine58-N1)-methyltransferase
MAETLEVLHRTWHIEARSVRPDHRMVGHTGFLTTARLLVPPPDSEPVEKPDSEPVEKSVSADSGEASADPA